MLNTFNIKYYIVWTTKNKDNILSDAMLDDIRQGILEISEKKKYEVIFTKCNSNQIHILVNAKPNVMPYEIVKAYKGGLGGKLYAKYKDLQKVKIWSNGYLLQTVGQLRKKEIEDFTN